MENTDNATYKSAPFQHQLTLIERMSQIQFDPFYSAWIPYALNQHKETLNGNRAEAACSTEVKDTQNKCIELKGKFEEVNKPGTTLKY